VQRAPLVRRASGRLAEEPEAQALARLGRALLTQARAAIACHTLAQGGYASSAAWRQAWIDHTTKTLGGTVFLRRVFPAVGQRETDIFDGL